MREVRVLKSLPPHPNIVRLEDAFQSEQGHIYLAFELSHCGLHRELRRQPGGLLRGATLKAVAWQLLRALAHCHEHGIVHRDVKPANVLVASPIGPASVARTASSAVAFPPAAAGGTASGPSSFRGAHRGCCPGDAADCGCGACDSAGWGANGGARSVPPPGPRACGQADDDAESLDSFECSPGSGVGGGMGRSQTPHPAAGGGIAPEDGAACTSAPTPDPGPAPTPFPLVKLCDFGFARSAYRGGDPWYTDNFTTYVVTRFYRAPEVLVGDVYGTPIDVWSYGCTLAELATGRPLFPGRSCVDQLWRISRCLGPLPARQTEAMQRDMRLMPLVVAKAAEARPAAEPEAGAKTVTATPQEPASGPLAAPPALHSRVASELCSGPLGASSSLRQTRLNQGQGQDQGSSNGIEPGGGGGGDGGRDGTRGGGRLWRGQRAIERLAQALPGVEPRLLHLIAACLTMDPARRPTVHQLLAMPYFWDIESLLCGTELEHLLPQNRIHQDYQGRERERQRQREREAAAARPPHCPAGAAYAAAACAGSSAAGAGGAGGGAGGDSVGLQLAGLRAVDVAARDVVVAAANTITVVAADAVPGVGAGAPLRPSGAAAGPAAREAAAPSVAASDSAAKPACRGGAAAAERAKPHAAPQEELCSGGAPEPGEPGAAGRKWAFGGRCGEREGGCGPGTVQGEARGEAEAGAPAPWIGPRLNGTTATATPADAPIGQPQPPPPPQPPCAPGSPSRHDQTGQLSDTPFNTAAATAASAAAASSPIDASCTTQYSGRTWLMSDDDVNSCRTGQSLRPASCKSGWGGSIAATRARMGTGTSSYLSSSTRPSLDSTVCGAGTSYDGGAAHSNHQPIGAFSKVRPIATACAAGAPGRVCPAGGPGADAAVTCGGVTAQVSVGGCTQATSFRWAGGSGTGRVPPVRPSCSWRFGGSAAARCAPPQESAAADAAGSAAAAAAAAGEGGAAPQGELSPMSVAPACDADKRAAPPAQPALPGALATRRWYGAGFALSPTTETATCAAAARLEEPAPAPPRMALAARFVAQCLPALSRQPASPRRRSVCPASAPLPLPMPLPPMTPAPSLRESADATAPASLAVGLRLWRLAARLGRWRQRRPHQSATAEAAPPEPPWASAGAAGPVPCVVDCSNSDWALNSAKPGLPLV